MKKLKEQFELARVFLDELSCEPVSFRFWKNVFWLRLELTQLLLFALFSS